MSGKEFHQSLLNQAKKARLLLINTFNCLRVLDLNGCQFEELPKRIGYMKHLRYLNLARNVKIKHLPDSVCNLINLQTLILTYCNSLEELPSDIGRLENLRYLMVTIQHEFLPESIGDMKSLRMLFLCNCLNLAFLPSSTKRLESLDTLFMFGCKKLDLAHGSWSLEGLNSLRVLGIHDFPKFQKLEIGVKGLSFPSLQHLFFVKCEGLTEITDWIKSFTSLKTLKIGDCYNLKRLAYTRNHFAMLENLQQIEINGETVV